TVLAGAFPRALVFSRDGKTLFAALGGANQVAVIDLASKKVVQRWPAAREPNHLAFSPNGRWLAAASTRSGEVRCWDVQKCRLLWTRKIEDGFNLAGLVFTPAGQDLICTHVVRRDFPVTRENIGKGWVIDSRLTRLTLKADALPNSWQVALDTRG